MTMTLTFLLPELLTSILDLLDIPDLLVCSRLSHHFHSLIHDSVLLQYKIELFAANLVDGPPSHTVTSTRLRILRDHQRAWNDVKWTSVHDIIIPEDELEYSAWDLIGGIFAIAVDRHLRFIQLPSAIRGIPRLEWTTPDIGFTIKDFGIDRSQDLLVVVELSDHTATRGRNRLCFHVRCLSDGRPHPLAREDIVFHDFTTIDVLEAWYLVQVYSDYVMIILQDLVTDIVSEVLFLNWRTGEQKVLHGPIHSVAFLTQDLVMCGMCRPPSAGGPRVLSLDLVDLSTTPTPLDMTARSSTRTAFLLPPLSDSGDDSHPELAIHTDYSPTYALASQHPRPFTTAPTDSLLAITTKGFRAEHTFALFAPTSAFLALAAARPRGGALAWAAWGPARTRMVRTTLSDVWTCFVHGMRVVLPAPDAPPGTTAVLDFNRRALRRGLGGCREDAGVRPQKYLTGAMRVDKEGEMFASPVVTALPCRVQSFKTPGLVGQEFMLAEDGLVLVQGDQFKVFSF